MISAAVFAVMNFTFATSPVLPVLPREFRGVWVATVDNIDWPSKKDLTSEAQRAEMITILDRAQSLNLNAVILQVRPSCDAIYPSAIEPWSEYLTGLQGRAPSPAYDPLKFAVTEAHKRGLELHCWFNPYRAKHFVQKGPVASNHVSITHPTWVKSYGKYLWLDPGVPEVADRSLAVIEDVVRRYDIDGVHIDDYFYPYPEGGKPFPDDDSYAAYQGRGGNLGRDDWRRHCVDEFVHRMYCSVKRLKPWVKMGISPFGIYRPGVPAGIKSGVDQFAELYADADKWLREGWCDYFTPQLYWAIGVKAQSYPVLLHWWRGQNVLNRHLWPGNYTGRTQAGEAKWKPDEIINQIRLTRAGVADSGNVHFSIKCLLTNFDGIGTALREGPYAQPSFVPASPWLSSAPPKAPQVEGIPQKMVDAWKVKWKPSRTIKLYGVSQCIDGVWGAWKPVAEVTMWVDDRAHSVAIKAINRFGAESPATVVMLGNSGDRK